jgi:uncharacterized Fe-S cluster-containing protein
MYEKRHINSYYHKFTCGLVPKKRRFRLSKLLIKESVECDICNTNSNECYKMPCCDITKKMCKKCIKIVKGNSDKYALYFKCPFCRNNDKNHIFNKVCPLEPIIINILWNGIAPDTEVI